MRCFVLFVLLVLTFISYGQPWGKIYGENANFFELQRSFNSYWQGRTPERSKGYKQFKRWEWYWQNRVNTDGSFPPAGIGIDAFNQYLKNKNRNGGQRSLNTANWTSVGPSQSDGGYSGTGRINALAFHPSNANIVFAGAAGGGLWKSTDGGLTWFTTTDNLASLGISSIAVQANDPNTVFVATGDADGGDNYSVGVLVSNDGGVTFNTTGLNWTQEGGRLIKKIIFDPDNTNTLLVAASDSLYRSTNHGLTWTGILAGDFDDIEANPSASSNTFYTCKNNQIYKSSDNGATWTLKKTIAGVNRIALAVTPADNTYVYALCSAAGNSGFKSMQRSTNSGDTFTERSATPNLLGWSETGNDTNGQGWYDLVTAADPVNAEVVYVGGVNMWKSTNGGTTWSIKSLWTSSANVATVHADKHALEWQNNTSLWEGNDGGIYKTTNGGNTWQHKSNGIVNSQMYKLGLSQLDHKVVAGLQDNGTKLYNSSSVWEDVLGGDGMECAIQHNVTNVVYGSLYFGEFYRSVNSGNSWSYIQGNIPGNPQGNWVTPFAIDKSLPTTIYAAYDKLYKSENRGNTWSTIGVFNAGSMDILELSPSDSKYIYVGKYNGSIWRTTNGGTNWNAMTNVGSGLASIAIHPTDPNTLFAVLQNYVAGNKVYKSTDGGASWTNISGSLPNLPANSIVFQEDQNEGIYVGMDVGLYYKDNTLSDWVLYNDGLPNVEITELEIQYDEGKLYASTYGRGVWSSDLYHSIDCNKALGVNVTNISNVSLTLSWSPPSVSPSDGYQWAIASSPTLPTSGTPTSLTSVYVTALTPLTTYYLFVRSNCGGGVFSPWTIYGPVTTLTPCPPPFDVTLTNIGPFSASFSME